MMGRAINLPRQQSSNKSAINVRMITSVDRFHNEGRKGPSICRAVVARDYAHIHFLRRNVQFLDYRFADDVTIRPRVQHPVNDLRAARRRMKDANGDDGADNFVLSDDRTICCRRR